MSTDVVGRPLSRVEARLKVTGGAEYTTDVRLPRLVHAFMAMSTVSRGRITRIDTRAAEAVRGVIAVYTHETMPRLKQPTYRPFFKPYVPIQTPDIHHAGQPIAFVVAQTLEQAQRAAELIEVDYEETGEPQGELAMGEAFLPPDGPDGPNTYRRGDVAAGLTRADVRVKAEYTIPMHHHNPIEPHATTAVWEGSKVTVYETTQGLGNTQHVVSEALQVPLADVRIVCRYLGGGFGSKGPVWPHTVLTCAAARALGRPVKLVLSRAHMYTSSGHRAQTRQTIELGAQSDGRITALDHVITQQVTRDDVVLFNSSEPIRMLYDIPNLSNEQHAVRLDLPTQSFMRSPEACTSHAQEAALDELAHALTMDPVELRKRNWSSRNMENGQEWGSNHLRECYDRAASMFGWSRRDPRPGSMRDGDELVGWGMATSAHTAGGRPGSGARMTIGTDGKALLQVGTQDIGTGTYTIMTQIAGEVLGMPLSDITFELGDSAFPQSYTSGASTTAPGVGSAVNRVCTDARKAVIDLAVTQPGSPLRGVPADRVDTADGYLYDTADRRSQVSYRSVVGHGGKPLDFTVGPTNTPLGYSVGAVFVEVRVDPWLGRVRVTRVVGCYDPGTVLNRKTARSQVLGGVIWGIGFTLFEHTLVDAATARIVNPNLSGYLIPVNADVPDIQVQFIDRPDPASDALGARGFGETPMTGVTAAIANAVFHATGKRVRDLPITQDKLL
ncbi:xanthine dehydrogenase YagR molybdenum-binding subunit [Streptomyces sp. SAI-135]|jgi:xanthine dehydrogenase YagR molybdenum-binding subunit|uniref:xanthine dehydrogenase family protein molybdopterin-binding subunit n=1 Tax=unclassified Streptomyces TaxID=2593676 RepID=UPI00247514FD|nr:MULTISPECIES: xanthine dehydrogenase family protein molybdopterin-binding subunit [unclassified Streptomyces]MDH6513772.1 xanthine dehydrogenase YagR molybdenum-binding subunit [Streptomyces sp. SAI-090]MDH6545945.1 xanthine dehydrogenase YagR molybdenum-binding subunit [Streptomyces sp. SAI-041]MDH6622148.1 xanthine dehydrogenase YagR molybdenum-binding subunit [Streptomyces sp. SAI-135]